MYVRLGVFVPQWLHQDSLNLLFSKMVSFKRLISYNCIETSLSALLLMITSLDFNKVKKTRNLLYESVLHCRISLCIKNNNNNNKTKQQQKCSDSILRRKKMASVHFTTIPCEPCTAHEIQETP